MGLTSTCKQFEAGSRVPWKPRKIQLEIADWFQKTDPMENQNDQLTQKQEALVSESEMRASNKGEGERLRWDYQVAEISDWIGT